MTASMTIGDFSRATRLSAKALRFYHRVGLLEPARVDPVNGYRVYTVEQIPDARVIRHFRALDMPVDQIRDVLAADVDERNRLIAAHLTRMEAQLEETRSAVASLRGLLVPADAPLEVSHRHVPATAALIIRETIDLADLSSWYGEATRELEQAVSTTRVGLSGPRGGIWDTALFLDERGEAALFVPVGSLDEVAVTASGRLRAEILPAVDLAVVTHRGADDTIGEAYAALGAYVARHELSIEGPIRESYVEEPAGGDSHATTDIGWPIFRTGR